MNDFMEENPKHTSIISTSPEICEQRKASRESNQDINYCLRFNPAEE